MSENERIKETPEARLPGLVHPISLEEIIEEICITSTSPDMNYQPTPPSELPSLQVGDWAIQIRHAEGDNPLVRIVEIKRSTIVHIHEGKEGTNNCDGFENFRRITEEEAIKMRNTPPPNTPLPVGTNVIIVPGTEYDGQAHGTTGIITSVDPGERHCYSVTWKYGGINSYRLTDIMPVDPQEVERLRQLAEKVMVQYAVKISSRVYNFLQEELKEFNLSGTYDYPFTYLLGEKEGIIKYLTPLHGYGGCKDMQHISSSSLTRAIVILAKKKARAIGIVKVGRFSDYDIYDANNILQNVEILWGMNKNKSWIYKMIEGSNMPRQIGYEIVKERR